MSKDYYEVLGVGKSASDAEIKKAYRKMALEWHPDRNKDPKATERFKEINKAYEILSDPQKKQAFDQFGEAAFSQGTGQAGGSPFGGGQNQTGAYGPFTYTYSSSGGSPFEGVDFGGFSDPFEIFEQFFGGSSSGRRSKPQRRIYRFTIDFMEAVKGVEKDVVVDGKQQKIKIPAGVNEGSRIRFDNFEVVLSVQSDSRFKREGYDLISGVEISFTQAVLGDVVTVPTIDGPLKLKIKPGTQPGSLVRLKGRGVPMVQSNARGDHYLQIKIKVPEHINSRQKELLEEYDREVQKKKGWF